MTAVATDYRAQIDNVPAHYCKDWQRFLAPGHVNYPELWPAEPSRLTAGDITEDRTRSYPGKFACLLDERVWDGTGSGHGSAGSVDDIGFYMFDLFTVNDLLEYGFVALYKGDVLPIGAIMSEDGLGFVAVTYYDTLAELEEAWQEIEDADSAFHADNYDDEG